MVRLLYDSLGGVALEIRDALLIFMEGAFYTTTFLTPNLSLLVDLTPF